MTACSLPVRNAERVVEAIRIDSELAELGESGESRELEKHEVEVRLSRCRGWPMHGEYAWMS